MATVKQYLTALQTRQRIIGRKFGADLAVTDKQTRVLVRTLLVLIAALVKTLTDKGVVSDAELNAVLDAARDDTYADEPVEPPRPPEDDPPPTP